MSSPVFVSLLELALSTAIDVRSWLFSAILGAGFAVVWIARSEGRNGDLDPMPISALLLAALLGPLVGAAVAVCALGVLLLLVLALALLIPFIQVAIALLGDLVDATGWLRSPVAWLGFLAAGIAGGITWSRAAGRRWDCGAAIGIVGGTLALIVGTAAVIGVAALLFGALVASVGGLGGSRRASRGLPVTVRGALGSPRPMGNRTMVQRALRGLDSKASVRSRASKLRARDGAGASKGSQRRTSGARGGRRSSHLRGPAGRYED